MSVDEVLRDILVVILVAKVAAELSERVSLPAVVGEIIAGILIGPSLLGLVGDDQVLRVLGEFGIVLLLLEVGMQLDLVELRAVGRASLLVASAGVVVPFVGGYLASAAFGESTNTALYVGGALTATSVGITARVFADLRAVGSPEARTVLGAAVADDVMGLVILTVIVRIVAAGSVSLLSITGIVALAIAFLAITGFMGVRAAPPLFDAVDRLARSSGTLVAVALAFTLGVAELATAAKLAPIVGAFVAGLALARTSQAPRIQRELAPIGHVFIPVFFLQIGIDARVGQFARGSVLGLAALLLAVAVIGKLASAVGAIRSPGDKMLIALGMIPRGEVGLIFAGLGLQSHVLGANLYAAVLLVVLLTTLITPPLLRWRLSHLRPHRQHRGAAAVEAPPGGWLVVEGSTVDVAASPPDHLLLPIALQAARLAAEHVPGPRLLDWIRSAPDQPLRWDAGALADLVALLDGGNARSWRFLEAAGILDRALPELAEAIGRRRTDPTELDPLNLARWAFLDELRHRVAIDPRAQSVYRSLRHPEWLLLAAVVVDAAGGAVDAVATARRLARRIGLGAAAEEELALLVGQRRLLLAAARSVDGLSERAVLTIAAHLQTPERAGALYLLSLAFNSLEPWERATLDQLYDLVTVALAHPELTGLEARNLAGRRQAGAARLVGGEQQLLSRIENAPAGYLFARSAKDIASDVLLLERPPGRDEARVSVSQGDDGRWGLVVVAADRPGLLARVTGVLADTGVDVEEATLATWSDGTALEAFRVRSVDRPSTDQLRMAIERSLGAPVRAEPVQDAVVRFDDDASPWYTLCDVRAPDRPGLLHAVAAAFAAADVRVHAARISTEGGMAHDRFDVVDRRGEKLDPSAKAQVSQALKTSRAPRPSRWWRGNKLDTRS